MYIAENSSSNIRELKSAVTKIIYQMAFTQLRLDARRRAWRAREPLPADPRKRLAVVDIQREVEKLLQKIGHSDMVGKKRPRHITYARKIAMYLCRQMLDLPFNDIGKKFNRDRTTVLYSVSDVEKQLKESRDMNEGNRSAEDDHSRPVEQSTIPLSPAQTIQNGVNSEGNRGFQDQIGEGK